MKKVVINKCFGGFSLSPLAVQELAKRQGRECYFFKTDFKRSLVDAKLIPITLEEAGKELLFHAYTVPNPEDFRLDERDEDGRFKSANERAKQISISSHEQERHSPDLVAVVEALGEKANGRCAQLKIVEIPDNVEYEIKEYDGMEHIAEKHRTWE